MSTDEIKAAAAASEFLKWFAKHGHEHATLILKEGSMLHEVEYWHCRQCELLENEGIPFAHSELDQAEIFAVVEAHTLGWSAQGFVDHNKKYKELNHSATTH